MKVQCDACEKAEAALLCCADEAALCWGCDEWVHAANKLAGKHQRVLTPNSAPASSAADAAAAQMPTCDICQTARFWLSKLMEAWSVFLRS